MVQNSESLPSFPEEFRPQNYGPVVARLLRDEPLCPLGPGKPDPAVRPLLDDLQPSQLGPSIADRQMAQCCLSGLWLLFNYLDRSHEISQSIGSAEGSYWHGIMHRREPDFSNSKYWFRRVGRHPVFDRLLPTAKALVPTHQATSWPFLASSAWDPFAFIDACQAEYGGGAGEDVLRKLAQVEWRLLFDHCYRLATGAGSPASDEA